MDERSSSRSSTPGDSDAALFEQVLRAGRSEVPPDGLGERIVSYVDTRAALQRRHAPPPRRWLWPLAAIVPALAAGGAITLTRSQPTAPIKPEALPGAAPSAAPAELSKAPDPCGERLSAAGRAPLIDDFEDGDDAILRSEHRAGFWRWARETDRPGTAPALLPLPRARSSSSNQFALHVKGQRLNDWGAAVEFTFEPACYDASIYAGVVFHAKGPGRIYLAPREVGVIPRAEGGVCEADCHNPHVAKVDLTDEWREYEVRWSDVRQRGFGKPPLDPRRLNSLAFLIRPEDTPYEVWLDDIAFIRR